MSKYETLSAKEIAGKYRIFRVLRHIATAAFVLFVALDLSVIIFLLVNGIELTFALEYCAKTAKTGVLIIFCMLWFGIRDVAIRAGMSKIGRVYGDYEKSKQVYEILVEKIKNKKLKNYFRYMKARDCAATGEIDEAVKILQQQDEKFMGDSVKYSKYLLLEDCFFSMQNYAEFEKAHLKTTESAKALGDKKYYKWIMACNEKLYDARKLFIDKDYENAGKAYDEALQLLRQKEYTAVNSSIAEISLEAAKLAYDLGDTEDAYHKARTAAELGGASSCKKEAEELLIRIKGDNES